MKEKKSLNLLAPFESFVDKFKVPLSILVGAFLIAVPFLGASRVAMRNLVMIFLYAMLGMGLNVLLGYVGQVSLGHAGFYAIGAYTSAILTTTYGWSFWTGAIAGACVAALIGFLLGLPTLRLSGTYLTIVTLGFGEIVLMVLRQWESVTNGNYGIRNIPVPELFGWELTLSNGGFYWLILFLSTVTAIACYTIKNSNVGRTLIAIKEDELAATMMGIKTTRYKILAFVVSAFITGLAGAYYSVINNGYIEPNNFVFNYSIQILSVVIVGGMGTIRGMYFGSALLMMFPQVFRFLNQWRFVIYGLLLVLMMQFRPQGALGWQSTLPYKLPRRAKKALAEREKAKTVQ